MTIRSRRSRWAKRGILPVAFLAMIGIGAAFAISIPASAAVFADGTGATPEAAIQAAGDACITRTELPEGSWRMTVVTEVVQLDDGQWQATVECVTP